MNIYDYLNVLKEVHPTKSIILIANDKSLSVVNYSYMGRNIIQASETLELLIKNYDSNSLFRRLFTKRSKKQHIINYALFDSFVMNYMKCFTKAASNKIKLDSNQIYKGLDIQKKLHKEIENWRNNFIAHDGSFEEEQAHCIIMGDPRNNRTSIEAPSITLKIPPKEKLCEFRGLISIMYRYCETKREIAMKSFAESIGLEILEVKDQ
ncbi:MULTISPECIES: hypothetical protein [Chryseobacterium]|uniref:hypothetical protein n=1 Tax=Chryseobacterium TaxID=59732 RepID=UPI001627C4D7|nr:MULTISPECIES: hypothetical protein [Chryseobacterium]MDM1553305.1 hypothetical protein [Chryseobacterium indologenes]